MRVFPQEILDDILDFLFDDPTTLGQCALASSCLTKTSREHRFRSITVKASHHRNAHTDMSEFLKLSEHQPFAQSIRELYLNMWEDKTDESYIARRLSLSLLNLSAMVARLSSLQHLSIYYADLELDALGYSSHSGVPALDSLSIERCRGLHQCLPLLLHLCRPQELELIQNDDLFLLDADVEEVVSDSTPSKGEQEFPLQMLDLLGELDYRTLQASESTVSRTTVHTIFIGGGVLSVTRFRDLGLLAHASPSLRKVRIGLFIQWGMISGTFLALPFLRPLLFLDIGLAGRWTSLFLSIRELSTLEIQLSMPVSGEWTQVVELLGAAPRSLQHIEIRILISAPRTQPVPASMLPNSTLPQELRRYQRLCSLNFVWLGDHTPGEPRVEKIIPHLNKLLRDMKAGVVQHEIC